MKINTTSGTKNTSRRMILPLKWMLAVLLTTNMVIAKSNDTTHELTYNLRTLFDAALLYDAEYQRAVHERSASDEEVVQAEARFLPSASTSLERSFVDEKIDRGSSGFTSGGNTPDDYLTERFTISVIQPLYRYDSIAGLLQAKARTTGSELNLKSARQALMLRVIERYLTILAAQDAVEFSSKEQQAVKEQFNLARARLKAQLGTEADLLEAKSRFSIVRANTISAKNVLDDALQALVEITGNDVRAVEPLGKITLSAPMPESVDAWINAALASNISILQRVTGVDIAREEVRKQDAAHHPTLDAVLEKSRAESFRDSLGQSTDSKSTKVTLQLNIPIYTGGTVNSRTRQAVKLMAAARSDLDQQRRAVIREVRASYRGVKSALNRITSLEEAVSAQQLVVKTRKAGFPRVYNSLDVLDAERDLYSAKRDLARANYDYLFSDVRLSASTGLLNEGELSKITAYFSSK